VLAATLSDKECFYKVLQLIPPDEDINYSKLAKKAAALSTPWYLKIIYKLSCYNYASHDSVATDKKDIKNPPVINFNWPFLARVSIKHHCVKTLKYILGQFSENYVNYQPLAELAALEIKKDQEFEKLVGLRLVTDKLLSIIVEAAPSGTIDLNILK
jgi:hypothetical protein